MTKVQFAFRMKPIIHTANLWRQILPINLLLLELNINLYSPLKF